MIPVELCERDQWVLWRYETVRDRETKVPYTVRGRRASSTSPQTWASYDDVIAARNGHDGIGYVLAPTDPYVGFDLDLCVNEDGDIHEAACDLVETMDSYCELSPSGSGLRIIARAELHSDRRETADVPWADFCPQNGRKAELAVFSGGRYLTFTGNTLSDFETIRDRQSQVDDVVAEYLPAQPRHTRSEEPQRKRDESLSGDDMRIAVAGVYDGLSDEEIADEIRRHRGYDRKSHRRDYIPRTIARAREYVEISGDKAYSLSRPPFSPLISTVSGPFPRPLGDDAYCGLAGDVVRAIEPYSEADPAAVLCSLLVAFGNAVGRGPHFLAGDVEHATNLFVCVVGETSSGRKGTSMETARRLVGEADASWRSCVVGGLVSGEGVIHRVRNRRTTLDETKPGKLVEKVLDPGVDDKRLLALVSEFAQLLAVFARKDNTLSAVLRDLWDRGDAQTTAKNSPERTTLRLNRSSQQCLST
jgi:hypothetical protein